MRKDLGLPFFLLFGFLFLICACEKAKDFAVDRQENFAELTFQETEDSLFIYWKDLSKAQLSFSKVKLPIKSCVVTNPSALPFLSALDKTSKISGIRGKETLYNQGILDKIEKELIKDLGTYQNTEVESIIDLKPDLVIASATHEHFKHLGVLSKFGVPVMYFNDYEEGDPLHRSAYIKIFGRLFGEAEKADRIYNEIEKNYDSIKEIVNTADHKPTVFVNSIYGDSWYMPGRKSSIAKYLKDAGALFLWETEEGNSVPLSFETVFKKAEKAEVWLNASNFQSLNALGDADHRYKWFSAYEKGTIYNPIKRKDSKGNNDIFETGILRGDWILKDFATILHPDLFPSHELYFYQKLE